MAQQYGDDVTFIGIAGDDPLDDKLDFVERYALSSMVTIHDPDGSIWNRFGVPGQPSWVFVDDRGEAVRYIGSLTESELSAEIERIAS